MTVFASQFKTRLIPNCICVIQIYTATNAKARELLNDHLVSEITMKWRIYFGPDKYSNADGLLRIIDDYRSAVHYFYYVVKLLCHFAVLMC